MRISLFIPCFVNACYPRAAVCIVEILERLGHTLDYPEAQTCGTARLQLRVLARGTARRAGLAAL